MERSEKSVVHDGDLHLDAYRFRGYSLPFPTHFHPDYVVGLVEGGRRLLTHRGRTLELGPGELLLLNPGDTHGCTQLEGQALDYRSLSIPVDVMADLSGGPLPVFPCPVVRDESLAEHVRTLHQMILEGASPLEKDETLSLLVSELTAHCRPAPPEPPQPAVDTGPVWEYLHRHLSERIRLEHLCRLAGCSISTLLRAFARTHGMTPYRCLESLRITRAKELLEQGIPPAEAALRVGFSDQSHFSRYFTRFIGLSPGAYQGMLPAHGQRKGASYGSEP